MRDTLIPTLRPINQPAPYNLSFTAASLRPELARIVAESYLATGDWDLAKERILSANALQCRSAPSAVRLERELRQRLETLTHDQLRLLAQATTEDRVAIAWLAACKHIQFVFDFASDVLRDKLATHDLVLRHSDYEAYFENKGLFHPTLSRLAPSSKAKIRQVLFRMLAEAGLLGKGAALGIVLRPVLSPDVAQVVTSDNPRWLAAFLVPDAEIASR
ncbi:MAG: hypothetical protein JWL90_328 [Chthoniobacteraceae bacterium]|nr:hypothetical protein [Chthoniobacteraceae bacterium]